MGDGQCENITDWNNGVTGGLDVYEPVFQVPEDQWEEAGGEQMYSVKITIPEDSLTQEFYYFCHIHSGMSGLMVVEDPAPPKPAGHSTERGLLRRSTHGI